MKAEQLRKSILQLAIQGKLVPQDPNDEPASVLLERIRAEKQRLIKQGKIKKDKGDSVIFKGDDNCYYEKCGSEIKNITDELPFEIPDSWCWVRLSNIANISAGGTPDRGNPDYWGGSIPWLKISDITSAKKYVNSCTEYITEEGMNNSSAKILSAGTILYTIFATIGEVGILNFNATCNQAIAGIQTYMDSINSYLYYYLVNLQDFMKSLSKGCAQFNINQKILKNALVPVPPLAEQNRIVAMIEKFEPLIAEYDKLEQQATKLDSEIYDKLKKSILQYAIQGKLVPQDENDEPASELLKRIRTEKKAQLGKKYVESYIYKGDDNCYYEKVGTATKNITDEIPFDIPDSWSWTRLNNVCSYIHRGKSPQYGADKILPIIAQKCNQWSGIRTEKCLFADKNTISKYSNEQFIKVGDILINSTGTGTVGRTGIVEADLFKDYSKFVADSHVTVVRVSSMIVAKYVWFFLKSPFIQRNIEEKCSGSTNQIELATSTIANYLLPIPSQTEQCKIVEKVTKIYEMIKGEI